MATCSVIAQAGYASAIVTSVTFIGAQNAAGTVLVSPACATLFATGAAAATAVSESGGTVEALIFSDRIVESAAATARVVVADTVNAAPSVTA